MTRTIYGWQTVLICFLVAPVFYNNSAQLLQQQQQFQHHATIFFPTKFPQYEYNHQRHANNAKNLETLNSKRILSRNDDLNHNIMVNAEKPVDTMHNTRIEQSQQKQETSNYIDHVGAKNKNEFFNEDGNKMQPHGHPGNDVLSRKFIDNSGNRKTVENKLISNPMIVSPENGVERSIKSFPEEFLINLAGNNVPVNFAQSYYPDVQLPFLPHDHGEPVEGIKIKKKENVQYILPYKPQFIIINGPTRLYGAGTEAKFPSFLEYFVQRIQKYFSVYKYEDLSRPSLHSNSNMNQIQNEESIVPTTPTAPANSIGVTPTSPKTTNLLME